MTYSDYSILQEDFSSHLYQNKFGNCVNNREGAFDEAILACKSILHDLFRHSREFQLGPIDKREYEVLLDRFDKKLKPECSWKKTDSKIIAYNSAIRICKSILEKHYKRWRGKDIK